MADLRTLTFYKLTSNATEATSHLFDRAIRIKKIVCVATIGGSATGFGRITFGKHATVGVHERPGDFFDAQISNLYTAAAGGAVQAVSAVIDLGSDYVDVQEDEYLYLVTFSTAANVNVYGHVIIYYVDK